MLRAFIVFFPCPVAAGRLSCECTVKKAKFLSMSACRQLDYFDGRRGTRNRPARGAISE
jgi:hypothetical protein